MKDKYLCNGILLFGCDPDCNHAEPHELCHYSDHVDCRDRVMCQNVDDFVGCEKVIITDV